MCGITGIYQHKSKKGDEDDARQIVAKINKAQVCRGPDDEGNETVDKERRVQFGHRRLSILDLSPLGHQPFYYKNFWITYNGEIYNFQELRNELKKKGHIFKTETDTEVILALYAEYGEESFSKLRGMFAFAIWDENKKQLILARDRYGIKPLYYYSDKEMLIFASMVRALKQSKGVPNKENDKAKIGFLLFGSVPAPETTIENVFSLLPGRYLVRNEKGEEIKEYYRAGEYYQEKKYVTIQEAQKEIRSILEKAVELHLISDAPLGIFLSGGLDSSALAALAAQKQKKLTTLSIVFKEQEFSEKEYQDEIVKKIHSDHKEILVTEKEFQDSFREIFLAMDQPTIDGVNSFFIAKAAKRAGLKTVLSGLGGDEIFLGYPSFKWAGAMRRMQAMMCQLRLLPHLASRVGNRYRKLQYLERSDTLSLYMAFRGLFTPDDVARILGTHQEEVWGYIEKIRNRLTPEEKELEVLHPADLISYYEFSFYLLNQLLKDTDSMAMYHSVEVRVPFLDHILVEYMSSLPAAIKLKGKISKQLLADAVSDIVPEKIRSKGKMGFTFPFEQWLKKDITLIQRNVSQESMKQFQSGKLHWSRVWAEVVLKSYQ